MVDAFLRIREIESRMLDISRKFIPVEKSKEIPTFEEVLVEQEKKNPANNTIESEVGRIAEAMQFDPALAKAVAKAESGFNPLALSKKGAMGVMQLMPKTAEDLGVEDPWDSGQNIAGGIHYLSSLFNQFGSKDKALAAYNSGPGNVSKYKGIPPFPETQAYVKKVKDLYEEYK